MTHPPIHQHGYGELPDYGAAEHPVNTPPPSPRDPDPGDGPSIDLERLWDAREEEAAGGYPAGDFLARFHADPDRHEVCTLPGCQICP